jgi:O-acetylhomoserine/O-acetylserine sulfhydrylase-like pyridoxal-dependent enzyme
MRCAVTFKKFGIGVKFVNGDDPASFAAAIDENTKAIYVESIGNPKYNVANIPELAKVRIQSISIKCYSRTPNGRSHTIMASR